MTNEKRSPLAYALTGWDSEILIKTGSAEIEADIKNKLYFKITELYEQGVRDFYCDVSKGYGIWAASKAAVMKEMPCFCELKLHMLVRTDPLIDDPAEGNLSVICDMEYLDLLGDILKKADTLKFCASEQSCPHKRDLFLLSNITGIISYHEGCKRTFIEKEAERRGIEVFNLYDYRI